MDEQGNPTSAWEFEKLSPEAQARLIARDHQEWAGRMTPAVDPRIDRSKLSADAQQALDDDVAPMTEAQRAAILRQNSPRNARENAERQLWKGEPGTPETIRIMHSGEWK